MAFARACGDAESLPSGSWNGREGNSQRHWLQSTFSTRFNRYREENGHLFQGRYRALLIEDGPALAPLYHVINRGNYRRDLFETTGAAKRSRICQRPTEVATIGPTPSGHRTTITHKKTSVF